MRAIPCSLITSTLADMCRAAACDLPADTEAAIRSSLEAESSERGRMFLRQYLENADIAQKERMPICQDTGAAVVFLELGQDVRIEGGLLEEAVAAGVEKGYKEGFLRKSIVSDPLFDRKNTGTNTPAITHISMVAGDKLKIKLAPKGGGSENMSALRMMRPSDGPAGVVKFVVDTVVRAGGNPCPPSIVGIGIGGNFEMCALLAKKALLREIGSPNPDPRYAAMEREILDKVNASGVGPQGLGGDTTALAAHIETYPCHLASLPVAVNLNCHVSRHIERTL